MAQSQSKVKVTLPDDLQKKFMDAFPDVSMSHVVCELLTWFMRSYEDEEGSLEEILSRLE